MEDLGIPCDSGCRILLTSRDKKTFKRMNVENIYELGVLSETEAWNLFKWTVGGCDDSEAVVKKVVVKCGGLPIALVTVGSALKGTYNPSIWEAALLQLESANPVDLPEVMDDVYKPLRLSYELLKSERAKSLFLMCCLYREDADIPLQELTIYAMGLGMFEGIKSLGEARVSVCLLVEMLKSRFLLLEGDYEDDVRMHDVVRDVATFIAKDEGRINSTWRSPFQLLSGSNHFFPSLRLLIIDELWDKELGMKHNFLEEMTKLNVLSITYSSMRVLPDTTALLRNLRALVLVGCGSLESVSVVGELANLEVLICRYCHSIKCLPVEMKGRLISLRLLELSRCRNLKRIAPGIISSLSALEELVMKGSFAEWGRKKGNAALSELESLSRLTRLEIEIEDSVLAAQNIRLSQNIVKYDIAIGGLYFKPFNLDDKMSIERKIELSLPRDINLGNWLRTCVGSAEWVCVDGNGCGELDLGVAPSVRWLALRDFSTMKKLVNSSSCSSTFPLLEVLFLDESSEVEEICDIDGPMALRNLKKIALNELPKLEHLWKSGDEHHIVSIFNNLSSIKISGCHQLRSLFSLSKTAWGCFSRLENLQIDNCGAMEQVFLWNEDKMVEFPKLKLLSLDSLPRLTSLCGGIENIEFPVLEEIEVSYCPLLKYLASTGLPDDTADECIHLFCKRPDKVGFGCLKEVFINGDGGSSRNWIWCRQIPTAFFAGLHNLEVNSFRGMKSLFSCSISRNLQSLRQLKIWICEEMVTVIEDEGEEENGETPLIRLFPNLKSLLLYGLTNLKSFCEWRCDLELPSLKELDIKDCICLDKFTSGPLTTPNLETIKLDDYFLTVTNKDVNTALERHRIEIASEVESSSDSD